jgi:hypothetical protein
MDMNILSGNMMDTGEMLDRLQSNIAFRVTSARDMVMGIAGESSMSPMQRRREIRQRRMELFGMRNTEDKTSATHNKSQMNNEVASGSATMSGSGNITMSSTDNNNGSSGTMSHSVPSMSDVDAGTKSRAEDTSFNDSY